MKQIKFSWVIPFQGLIFLRIFARQVRRQVSDIPARLYPILVVSSILPRLSISAAALLKLFHYFRGRRNVYLAFF